jgi:hypothetical protein
MAITLAVLALLSNVTMDGSTRAVLCMFPCLDTMERVEGNWFGLVLTGSIPCLCMYL